MKKNGRIFRMAALVLVVAALSITAFAAAPGSEGDPLVTLSYLKETFYNAIMTEVDEKIDGRNTQIAAKVSGSSTSTTADTFTVVTLTDGQILTGDIGCEVMLRVGSAVCVSPSSPGLIDQTDASILNDTGVLVRNHLYMMTIEERGVKATAATTKLLVRGGYTIT